MGELDKLVEHIEVAEKALLWADKRIRELEAERQWQPIETAPKDGETIILVCSVNHQEAYDSTVATAIWGERYADGDLENCMWINWNEGKNSIDDYTECDNLTHWMPLPKPPAD